MFVYRAFNVLLLTLGSTRDPSNRSASTRHLAKRVHQAGRYPCIGIFTLIHFGVSSANSSINFDSPHERLFRLCKDN